MYESLYGFNETPFRLCADEQFCYAHSNYERTADCITYALKQGEGILLLTGPPGSGKTILCRDVISKLDPNKFIAINLMMGQLSAEELLRKIALESGMPAEEYNKATLLSSIHQHLNDLRHTDKRLILFLDEAHILTKNTPAELSLLSDLQQEWHSVLQLVLIGNPELRESVEGAGIEHILQRISAVCKLKNMTAEQTEGYIKHRLHRVGWRRDPVIERLVYSIIYDVTQGLPRLINHLMSRLLLVTALENRHQISIDDVLSVAELLIEEGRLRLHSYETIDSLKERYIPVEPLQDVSTLPCERGNTPAVEPCSCEMVGSSTRQSAIGDSTAIDDAAIFVHEAEQEFDEFDLSLEDLDMPDTEWMEWDSPGPSSASNGAMNQATHSSGEILKAEFEQNSRQKRRESHDYNSEHQWGGVWWMSVNDKRKIRISSDDVGELPSVTIDGCPDMFNEPAPQWVNDRRGGIDMKSTKRKVVHAFIVVSFVLLILFVFRFATG
ncbi:MAG: AAA family ATPase [Candidatus Thiodiazotropha sp. (ex Cardiolucina cf. quadrata)]|nr:AAA family ATPase [Candidatus Thiodiazotropha sp. (ex Cardiolucina cf. quadrata)]